MNPSIVAEVALAISCVSFVGGVIVSARVIKVAKEAKAKAESVVSAVEAKAVAIKNDIL